ncbi:hypothetical protein HDK77DRAFT_440158 [Phyllosticta capitalensis]
MVSFFSPTFFFYYYYVGAHLLFSSPSLARNFSPLCSGLASCLVLYFVVSFHSGFTGGSEGVSGRVRTERNAVRLAFHQNNSVGARARATYACDAYLEEQGERASWSCTRRPRLPCWHGRWGSATRITTQRRTSKEAGSWHGRVFHQRSSAIHHFLYRSPPTTSRQVSYLENLETPLQSQRRVWSSMEEKHFPSFWKHRQCQHRQRQ